MSDANTTPSFSRRRFTTPCTVTVLHTEETLEAHVTLAGGVEPNIGDRVMVHGAPVAVRFGESVVLERQASVVRASVFDKILTRIKSMFLLTELYEVSFSTGSLK